MSDRNSFESQLRYYGSTETPLMTFIVKCGVSDSGERGLIVESNNKVLDWRLGLTLNRHNPLCHQLSFPSRLSSSEIWPNGWIVYEWLVIVLRSSVVKTIERLLFLRTLKQWFELSICFDSQVIIMKSECIVTPKNVNLSVVCRDINY